MDKKLIITKEDTKETDICVRIGRKANALVDDIVKKSGRSKTFILNRMVEFAYDYIEIESEDEDE